MLFGEDTKTNKTVSLTTMRFLTQSPRDMREDPKEHKQELLRNYRRETPKSGGEGKGSFLQ